MHTAFSHDSNVLLELYAAQAAELGIREIAITDHVDFMPSSPGYRYFDYEVRRNVIGDAAGRWAGKVEIRHGVEITYESRYEDEIGEYLRKHTFDYAIGSVHAVSDSPYARARIETFVSGKTVAEAVAPYFAEVEASIRSGMFDTVGHLDQCKRWLRPWFPPADFATIPGLVRAAARGAGGQRHGAGGQLVRAALPGARDVSGGVGRGQIPRTGRAASHRGIGRSLATVVRVRAGGSGRDRRCGGVRPVVAGAGPGSRRSRPAGPVPPLAGAGGRSRLRGRSGLRGGRRRAPQGRVADNSAGSGAGNLRSWS
jgi:histidinol-phosphatase (PHP family)